LADETNRRSALLGEKLKSWSLLLAAVPDRGNGSGHSERVGSNQQIHNGHYYFRVFPSPQKRGVAARRAGFC